jgi:glycosyltransferase involved in cell wall biosynthesis
MPKPSMEGGMTATTHMYYEVGVFDNPKIKHFNTSFTWSGFVLLRLIEAIYLKLNYLLTLMRFKPDAIFVIVSPNWGYYDKIFYCLIAKFFGIKSFFNNVSGGFIDFNEKNKINRFLIKSTISVPDVIVVGSSFWTSYFKRFFPDCRTIEIANPVICKDFAKDEIPLIKDDIIRFVSAMRITKEKGVIELVQVIKSVLNQTNNIEFTILGEGPEYKWMTSALASYKQVYMPGFTVGNNKTAAFKEADAFILLSHFEMMPIAILEAMASGLAIFSTRVGGIPDMVINEKNGFLFDKDDTKHVAERILYFVNKKKQLNEMGQNSQLMAYQNYDIDIIIKKQLELINHSILKT